MKTKKSQRRAARVYYYKNRESLNLEKKLQNKFIYNCGLKWINEKLIDVKKVIEIQMRQKLNKGIDKEV